MDKELLLKRVEVAQRELTEASADLDKVIREIKSQPRAEKIGVSDVVKRAFVRLEAARVALVDLKDLPEVE